MLEMTFDGGVAGTAIQFGDFEVTLADWTLRNCWVHLISLCRKTVKPCSLQEYLYLNYKS
jgi:hypothetical protein